MGITSKSALFDLINSLSTNEKRYIKQFINKSGDGNSNHVKLLNAIAKQDQYNEEKLKKKFRNTSLLKQWSRVKNYLYNYILRTLQAYHQQDVEFELYNNLQYVSILHKKGLYSQAHKLLKKTKYIALEGGSATLLPKIAEMEMVVDNLVKYQEEEMEPLDYKSNNAWATDIAHNMLQYNESCVEVFRNSAARGRHTKLENINQQILSRPMYASEQEAQSPMGKWFFYVAKIVLNAQIGKHFEAYSNAKACLAMHKEYPLLQKYAPLTYITSLNNFIQATIDAQQWHELSFIKEEIDFYIEKHKTSTKLVYLQGVKYVTLLHIHIVRGEHQAAFAYVDEIEAFLETHQHSNKHYAKVNTLLYHLLHICIVNGAWEKALVIIERLEQAGINSVDICRNNLLLLKLIVLLEKDETLLLPYAVRSAYRGLLKKENLFPLERFILNLLKTSVNAASQNELQNIFMKYLKKINDYVPSAPRSELELLTHFDYIAWIESKITGVALLKILAEKEDSLVLRY